MYRGSLFERLTSEFKGISFEDDAEAIYNSIANNLSKIFSSYAGSSETARDYGRPDLNDISININDSIENIERFSENCIKKYEPRLLNGIVIIDKDRLVKNEMNVEIIGYLIVNGKTKKINFKADLLKNGKVEINKDGI